MRNTFDNFIKPIRTMDYKPVYEKYAAGTTDDNCNLAALGDLPASNDGSLTKSIFNHIRNRFRPKSRRETNDHSDPDKRM